MRHVWKGNTTVATSQSLVESSPRNHSVWYTVMYASSESLSGAEYFLTFIDDKTRYIWVYVLKRKDQVFKQFLKWKGLVEKSTGRKMKALRTDNGDEFM